MIVYTDEHEGSLATLSAERVEALMWVWRHRYAELGAREDVRYVMIFENRGVEVGVTLHHPHGQVYAYPFLPPVPKKELQADARAGGCAMCALLAGELRDRRRLVYECESVACYVPFAARWAFEVHVVLRAHRRSLLDCDAAERRTGMAAARRTFGVGAVIMAVVVAVALSTGAAAAPGAAAAAAAPGVTITAPANGTNVTGPTTIQTSVSPDVTRTELYVDGVLYGSD